MNGLVDKFAGINFRERPENYDFAGINFRERPKNSRNRESFYPRNFLPYQVKYQSNAGLTSEKLDQEHWKISTACMWDGRNSGLLGISHIIKYVRYHNSCHTYILPFTEISLYDLYEKKERMTDITLASSRII